MLAVLRRTGDVMMMMMIMILIITTIIILIIVITEMLFTVLSLWQAIVRVRPVRLMNVDLVPGGCQPSNQDNQLGLRICRKRQLPSACSIVIYY